MLFIGYSGYPVTRIRTSTEAVCRSSLTVQACVHYVFPSWLLTKAVFATLMANYRAEIQVSLTVRNIVSTGAEIVRLQYLQDVNGLRQLFSNGLASPNDSIAGMGQSILQVREPT